MNTAGRILLAVLLLYVAYAALVFFRQKHIIFPGWNVDFEDVQVPSTYEKWTVSHEEGESYGYFRAAEVAAPAVVILHGNGSPAEHMFPLADDYHRSGFTVLVPEYRGYQNADGTPSDVGIGADVSKLVERLQAHERVDRKRILYHGISLGGGVAGTVAAAHPPAALVLESTFSSVSDLSSKFFLPGFLARDKFDTNRVLESFDGPVLVIHGTADPVVPSSHGEVNAKTAKNSELVLIEGAGHVLGAPDSATQYLAALRKFLRTHGFSRSADESASP